MSPSLTSHDTRRRDALSIDALVDRPSTRQCGKCQEAQTRCDGREPCRNCEVRGTLCGYAWSSFSGPHTLLPGHPAPGQHAPAQSFPPPAKHRSPVPTGSIFPRSNAINGGWAIVPQGTNAPTAHPSGPVLSCKTCQARNTPCDGVTPVCGSCRIRRLECYLATPASSHPDRRNGNSTSMTWSARDRQALNPRSFPPSLSQAAMLLPPSRPRAPSDASKPSSSRASLMFMLNPKPEGKLASGSKPNAQRPAELKPITSVTTPVHHVTPPTPVAPTLMEKAQAAGMMDVDPPTSPGSSSGGATLSRRPSRKRSASPESHYGREREDSPGRESVASLGLSALAMGERRRNRALSHVHSPKSSMDSHPGRHALEPHSPRGSMDMHPPRNSIDSHPRSTRNSIDSHPSHSARGSMDSHSPTRSTRNSLDLHSRGQPLDEAHSGRGLNSADTHLNHPHPNSRPTEPHSQRVESNPHAETHLNRPGEPHAHRPMDTHPIDAHRRSIDSPQSIASPIDPNRPRSRSKSSLSHLLDGGGFGGITSKSPVHTSPIHTTPRPADTTKPTSTTPPRTTITPPHTARPLRTPSSEFGPGPSPTAHGPGPSPKPLGHSPTASRTFGPGPSPTAYGPGPSPTATKTFGSGPSPTTPFGPGPSSQPYGPAKSPTATSSSEPFSRPVSAESFTRPLSRDLHREPVPPPTHKASISTALADMNLKSAGTSRASSPGGHGRDVFVHSAFNGANPSNPRPYPWTFSAAGENIKSEGRMANVWRHETEAGMRRREAEAELRKQDQVELQRRRSEGAKRRKLGEEDGDQERRDSSTAEERRMSIVAEERRMSIIEPDQPEPEKRASVVEPDRRMSIIEPEKRMVEPEKRMSGIEMEPVSMSESERQMSIVEQLRKATGVAAKDAGRGPSNSLPNPRATTDVFGRSRRESAPMPGKWIDDKSKSPIVINDSPEAGIGDAEMNLPEPSETLFPERTKMPDSTLPGTTEGGSQLTPLAPFGHIWPPPVIGDSGKKARRQKDPEPVPARSFITPLNLPPTPATTQVKQSTPVVDEEAKDKEVGPSQLSGLRSMLTTMPPPTAFGAALQEFISTPATKARRNRAIVMTKTLMKDALGVLLDPNTDELLKDYVPPERKKEDEKPDGARRKMSVAIDTTDHTSLEFRAWAKRMFSTIKTSQDKDVLAFDGKPVVAEDDIYTTIMICHSQGNHCSIDETAKLVDQEHVSCARLNAILYLTRVCRAGCLVH
ncbi:hypothetical protein ACGC1H_004023 [Rhizoctonia solani]